MGQFWDIVSGLGSTAGTGLINQGLASLNDKRQKEFMELQMQNQMKLNKQGQALQLDTWKKTNYEAQMKELARAGLNPSLLYGKGGMGGVTGSQSGGSASMSNATPAPFMEIGALDIARKSKELELLDAQTQNVKANTSNTLADEKGKSFEQAIKDEYSTQYKLAKLWNWNSEGVRGEEEWKAWQIRKVLMYNENEEGKTEYEKGLVRNIKQLEADLRLSKEQGNEAEFNANIAKFKSKLADQGIPPDSPWQAKLIVDLLDKIGIGGVIGETLKGIKKAFF